MAKGVSALEYVLDSARYPVQRVCVVHGDELFLRRRSIALLRQQVLGAEEGSFSFASFDGQRAQWADVLEELETAPMFGPARLVVVEDADQFVARYRTELEEYVARPSRTAVLVLDLQSFSAATRLYKAVAEKGLLIHCKVESEAELRKWLIDWARHTHRISLSQEAAATLLELVEPELGLLDQELAKLALMARTKKSITPELIGQLVSGGRAKTAFQMIELALDGNAREALVQLDRLLALGEQPIGVLAQISYVLRKYALATRIYLQAEAAGRRPDLGWVVDQAGLVNYREKDARQKAERRLRRLGRHRGLKLYDWLLQADLDLKGASSLQPRCILERLLVQVAAPAEAVIRR